MTLGIYCIEDIKSSFMSPTVDANDATARRNFDHAVKNTDSVLFTHREDFRLMKIGAFDTVTGCITSFPNPILMLDGKDVVL